jgi:hypothetical protein
MLPHRIKTREVVEQRQHNVEKYGKIHGNTLGL